ncbi:hypothetical protein [Inediibacterium massiliense]|uniref:hypothetical protein n=1 Tax=Inediibacterium massiliense TaxID=1658111 RepID=UPI0006B66ACC|nr:hypothetical protein [Inediibacterium massiliense]
MWMYLMNILWAIFIIFFLGYIFTILKEKYYLWNHFIFIDSKAISQEHIDEVETRYFKIGKIRIMAGDEMKIYFHNKNVTKGIIVGAKLKDNRLLIVNPKDEVEFVNVDEIKDIKIISRYGKFFNFFE